MPTSHILTAENRSEVLKPSSHARVAIMTPVDDSGNSQLCDRWDKPFLARGVDIIRVPVGTPGIPEILAGVDGLLMPGGNSNINPFFYTGIYADFDDQDIARDEYAIELLRHAYDIDLPTLGVCRGMQEMVVAFDGQLMKLVIDKYDHGYGYKGLREDGSLCLKTVDELVHPFIIEEGGHLSKIYNRKALIAEGFDPDEPFWTNSTHHEGTTVELWNDIRSRKLRERFIIEARAPDNVVEAISARNKTFFVGVQPHFEIEGKLHQMLFDTPKQGFMHFVNKHQRSRTLHLIAEKGPDVFRNPP